MGRLVYTTTNRTSETVQVSGVLVDPSAGSWVLVIENSAGNVVFSARGADATTRHYPVDDDWVGANVTTATNLTRAVIYTK